MLFWAIAIAAALLAALVVARPLIGARRAAASRAERDLQVYRDQLAAVDGDLERGVLTAAEAEGARAEISRRLIAAADAAEAEKGAAPAPAALSRGAAAVLVVAVAAVAVGLYSDLGAPGLNDQPLAERRAAMREAAANRPDQETAEKLAAKARAARPQPPAPPEETLALIDKLRKVVAGRPTDVRGRRLLAGALLGVNQPVEARHVYDEVLSILGDKATATDYVATAEAMIIAAGGYVSPGAEAKLSTALEKDPNSPLARYYAGLALAQTGRADLALAMWKRLLEEGPDDAPWIGPIRAQIGDVAAMAGQPSPVDEAASNAAEGAAAMSPEERAQMIEGMVARLSDRLAREGGPPEDWARLIRAYRVLGRDDDAAKIRAEAEGVFKDDPEALSAIRAADQAPGKAAGE